MSDIEKQAMKNAIEALSSVEARGSIIILLKEDNFDIATTGASIEQVEMILRSALDALDRPVLQ